MINFALKEIKEIRGKIQVYKLICDKDCDYDLFEKQILKDGSYEKELYKIFTRLHEMADCKSLPQNKFKDITPKNDIHKEYEIKTDNLRVYLFHEKQTGRIIVLGGKKTDQKSDIKRFRNLKKEYLEQAQHTQIQKL